MPKQIPRITLGTLTDRVYVVTRYRDRNNGIIEAKEKFDVTNQIGDLLQKDG